MDGLHGKTFEAADDDYNGQSVMSNAQHSMYFSCCHCGLRNMRKIFSLVGCSRAGGDVDNPSHRLAPGSLACQMGLGIASWYTVLHQDGDASSAN